MGIARRRALRSGSRHGERGAVAVIVAIGMVVFLALAALVLDGSNMWQHRRRLVTATDAAALAAARAYAFKEGDAGGACAVAVDYVKLNDSNATTTCSVHVATPSLGYVKVTALREFETGFGGLLGSRTITTRSRSYARWGTPRAMAGILPFGVCRNNPDFDNFSKAPYEIWTVPAFNPQDQSDTCVQGNGWMSHGDWATVALAGMTNLVAQDVNNQVCLYRGYQDDLKVEDWVHGDEGNYYQNLYNDTSQAGKNFALECMLASYQHDPNQWYGMTVLDRAQWVVNHYEFHIVGFVGVQVTGPPVKDSRPGHAGIQFPIRYFQFPAGESPCCEPSGGGVTRSIRLCAIDAQSPDKRCLD